MYESKVFEGYWRQPDKTSASFSADGWFKTGELESGTAMDHLMRLLQGSDHQWRTQHLPEVVVLKDDILVAGEKRSAFNQEYDMTTNKQNYP